MTIRPLDHPPLAAFVLPAGPLLMLMLCFCGMMIGLTIDLQSVLPQTIVALCLGSHSLVDTVVGHALLLPATTAAMFLSGFVVLGVSDLVGSDRRAMHLPAVLGCNLTMLAGMFVGEWLGPHVAAGFGISWTLAAMVAAMALGMSAGMALWTGVHSYWRPSPR